MAIVIGTSAGFVSSAPTGDPNGGSSTTQDTTSRALKDTAPVGSGRITEIGWYCNNATPESNFEVGLYSHDAGNDVSLNRLYVDNTNAKGTGLGWKTVAVDWEITAETIYWLAIQLDNTTPNSNIDYETTGGRTSIMTGQSSLLNPWVSGGITTYIMAIYAVWDSGITYSELAGTVASTSTVSGNLSTTAINQLSGTIATTSSVSGNLGSTTVDIDVTTSFIKRLVVAGNNQIQYESI